MDRRRLRIALTAALTATFACSTLYLPKNEPLTEASLSGAIETLRDSDGRVQLLEDGIVVDLFVYEWRRVETNDWHDRFDSRMAADFGTEAHFQRRLVGPKRGVYLPYPSILAVRARSWPLWSGVELELDATFKLRRKPPGEALPGRAGDGGPVVIKARDEQDAQELSEAIDRLRRARLPGPEPADSKPTADDADASAVDGTEPESQTP